MLRKFLMTSVLVVFLYPGKPSQIAAGLMISLVFLVLNLFYKPYCTDGLNNLQVTALLANVFTLFVGIMLVVTKYLEDQAIRAGESFDTSQRDVISVIVFLANMIVLGLPLLSALAAVRIPTSATRAMACCGGKIEEEPAQDTALPGGPQPNIHLHGEIALLQDWEEEEEEATPTLVYPKRLEEGQAMSFRMPVPSTQLVTGLPLEAAEIQVPALTSFSLSGHVTPIPLTGFTGASEGVSRGQVQLEGWNSAASPVAAAPDRFLIVPAMPGPAVVRMPEPYESRGDTGHAHGAGHVFFQA